jgi:hypothetical protein
MTLKPDDPEPNRIFVGMNPDLQMQEPIHERMQEEG